MMRLVTLALFLLVITIPSQAKTTAVERAFLRQQRHELKIRMQMKSVWVHALPKAQRRLAVISDLEDDGNDDPAGPDELDLQVLYRRPEVVKIQQYVYTCRSGPKSKKYLIHAGRPEYFLKKKS